MKSPTTAHPIRWLLTQEFVDGIEMGLMTVPAWDRSMPRTLEYWRMRGHHC